MNFSFETQGPVTYLVGEVEPKEVIDTLTLGMLLNNHIFGFAPVLYTELDGRRFLKYNISAKLTANQFFAGNIPPARAIEGFKSILNAICMSDEYMIDSACFEFDADRIFINISSCEVAMICVPVIKSKNVNGEIINLFKLLLNSSGLYDNPDMAKIKDYIEMPETFNIYNLKNLVDTWIPGAAAPASAPAFGNANAQPMPNTASPVGQQSPQNDYVRPKLNNSFSAPPSPQNNMPNLDGTISMDQAPKFFGGTNASPTISTPPSFSGANVGGVNRPNPQPQPPQRDNFKAPSRGVQPPKPPVPPVRPPVGPGGVPSGFGGRPIAGGNPPIPNGGSAQNRNAQPGIAIPGRAPQPAPQQPQVKETDGKMSFMKLMLHYNKENVALYKAQKNKGKDPAAPANIPGANTAKPAKEDKKGLKKKSKGEQPQPQAQPIPGRTPIPGQPNNFGAVPGPGVPSPYNGGFQGQPIAPVRNPAVNAAPIANSFNETTVLSPLSGETTVLGGVNEITGPRLTRIKTGEKISVDKPVFRIGKERSYVDYFILDNTAISRSHANIITAGNEYFIEDTNSTNHTFVNGKMISANEKVKLSNGDNIRLANEEFCFSF